MAGGLAVLDAVRSLGIAETRLDWPNDVLAGEAKIAGILVETRGLEPHAPHYVVGVGLNVTQLEFPASLRAERRVASLRMLGSSVTVVEARDAVLPALAQRMDQVTADETVLESDYLAATGLEGRRVRVHSGDGTWIGMLDRISIAEGLVLAESRDSSRRFPLEIVREVTACL
jgi:BirA family biotin operon repressor/biotin-[acetyl-CoA-carboxylase] ligase